MLKRRTARHLETVRLAAKVWGQSVQHFEVLEDYEASSWPHPRRVLVKLEANDKGTNRRFVVTNLCGDPQGLYHGFYVQRGNVPERPIGQWKNDLEGDRLSAHGFTANAMRLGLHTLAYAIMVLFREAVAAEVPELATAEVGTIRQRLLKVGARDDQRAADLVPLLGVMADAGSVPPRLPCLGPLRRLFDASPSHRPPGCRGFAQITSPGSARQHSGLPVEIPCAESLIFTVLRPPR